MKTILASLLLLSTASAADFHVSHDGVEQFCATGLVAGTYNFTGTCSAPPVSGCPATITVPDGSTRTLLRSARVTYGPIGTQSRQADLTTWGGLWGHGSATDPEKPWAGVGGAAPVIRAFPKNGYVCASFKTPAVMTAARSGSFSNPSYVNGPNLTMAITSTPANIIAGLPSPGAIRQNVPTSDANLVSWKGGSNAPDSWANLAASTTYYVVLFVTTPATVSAPTTIVGTVSYSN